MKATMYAHFSQTVQKYGMEQAVALAAELGCTSVELLELAHEEPTLKSEADAKQLRAILERRGMSAACYSVGVNLWQKGMTAHTVTPMEEALMRHARLAAALGSPFLHHTVLLGVPADALTMECALELLVPVAIRVAKYAHSLGVVCIYEGQGMYFNGVEGYRAFYEAVKKECPYVGVCGDVGNPLFVDEDSLDFIRTYAKDIRHVHIKDYLRADRIPAGEDGWLPTRGGAYLKDTTIGQGCVRLAECIAVLRAVGYEGAYAMEDPRTDDIEAGITAGIRMVKKYL